MRPKTSSPGRELFKAVHHRHERWLYSFLRSLAKRGKVVFSPPTAALRCLIEGLAEYDRGVVWLYTPEQLHPAYQFSPNEEVMHITIA